MVGKVELEGMCNEVDGTWKEPGDYVEGTPDPLDKGVYVCDLGNSEFTLFSASEGPSGMTHDEVILRDKQNDSTFEVDPYQLNVQHGDIVVDNVSGYYYDGFTNNRIDNGTVTLHSWDGNMEVEQTITY